MPFFAELKRRNVFRVALLYIVTAWVTLQVTDVLFDMLELPATWARFVLALLILGFPVAILFSWLYEMTPAGLRRESENTDNRTSHMESARKVDRLIVVLLVLAIAGIALDRLLPESEVAPGPAQNVSDNSAPAEAAPDQRSIAVLPFADLSPNKDQQYFTDGLSEELLNLLVRVDGLRVASRTSSFAYRDSTVGMQAIARELGVAYVLEGSVRKQGDLIRITAQLINSRTDTHLWSENYNRRLEDIFEIQDEIANAIVSALSAELGSVSSIHVSAPTKNLDAYEMYLTARELFLQRRDLAEAISLYRAAIALDPEFARAWEGLAAAEVIGDDWIRGDGIDHIQLAEAAARKALELDPSLSMPFAVLGVVASKRDDNLVEAMEYYVAAIDKDPMNTSAWLWLGVTYKYAGLLDEAIKGLQKCLDIDPAYFNCMSFLAESYLFRGDIEAALRLHAEAMENGIFSASPSFVSHYVRHGNRELALVLAGKKMMSNSAPVVEWIRAIEEPERDHSAGLARLKDYVRQSAIVDELPPQMIFSFRAWDEMLNIGEMQRRMLWHEDAAEFRRTPQFKEIVVRRGFLDFWHVYGFPSFCRPLGDDDFECV